MIKILKWLILPIIKTIIWKNKKLKSNHINLKKIMILKIRYHNKFMKIKIFYNVNKMKINHNEIKCK